MNLQKYIATKQHVLNRGVPPDSFLAALVEFGRTAPDEIFAQNANPADIYASVKGELGPFGSDLPLRRAAMLEVMRVHSGFESSWNPREGVDVTNRTSMAHIEGQETGAFQVSFDSLRLGSGALMPFAQAHGIETPRKFIDRMKADLPFALEYYARLVRVSTQWAGPLKRREAHPWLRRDAMAEFQSLIE